MKILVQTDEPCGRCDGEGHVFADPFDSPGVTVRCSYCQGTGHKLEWVGMAEWLAAVNKAAGGRRVIINPDPKTTCTCHERDSSYVCQYCYSQGLRGHMQEDRP